MRTVSVRELRNEIPKLRETLEVEHELLLVSNGEPIARILPVTPKQAPRLRSLAHLRARVGRQLPDSTAEIRAERDRRGT
jgi:antitoxin (DNA-binding transcriptional repressor) of toxin-antitoxin stability system